MNDKVRALLEGKNFGHVTTLKRDGTPHPVLVWLDTDGEHVEVNTAKGRDWPANLRRAERAWILVANRENPYEYAVIEARIAERTTEGADEHIDRLAKKYLDADTYPFRQEGEVRVIYRLSPVSVRHQGG